MILLVTKAEASLLPYETVPGDRQLLGRLVQPRHYGTMIDTDANGRPWAADNDCFNGLDPDAYRKMVRALPPTGRFLTVPDVVADHERTLALWGRWAPFVMDHGHCPAFVLQDGCRDIGQVPEEAGAVFVGGTTGYKLSPATADLIIAAKRRGLWVHMGRAGTGRRLVYAISLGVDSVDSSGFSRWSDDRIPPALAIIRSAGQQMSLLH